LAEEAGASAAWLAAAGFPFDSVMIAALLADSSKRPRLIRSGNILELAGEGVGPAIEILPSACDLVIASASAGQQTSVAARVDVPALAIAQAALAAAASAVPLAIAIGSKLSAIAGENSIALFRTIDELAALRCDRVGIRLATKDDALTQPAANAAELAIARGLAFEKGVVAEDSCWQEISSLAARTLVPATTRSREHGAGAGLIDSD
jgi:hypothetical protein